MKTIQEQETTAILAMGAELELLRTRTPPLSDFEIKTIMAQDECWIGEDCSMPDLIRFARAIEERHGIK